MIKLVIVTCLSLMATGAFAQFGTNTGGFGQQGIGSNPNSHSVSPYSTSRGSTVGGHHSTNPNNTQLDNYSTRGNINPYTGQVGTRAPRY